MSQQKDENGPPGGPSPLQLVGIGFELVVPVLMGLFGGRWLDRRLGTGPWLLMVGAFVGAAAGMIAVYRRIAPHGGSGNGGRP